MGAKTAADYCCVRKSANPAAAAHPVFALTEAEY